MMEIHKKYLRELIALYTLEKNLNDIYVEGAMDKSFIENFLKNKSCKRKVVEVDIVDFSELQTDYLEGLDINSNRNKLIILSKVLNQNLPSTSVKCIIDKDFDDYRKSISNKQLLRTDFSCMESYLFCENVIEKFFKMGIGNFPFETSKVLSQLERVLKPLFCIRLLRLITFPSTTLVKIDNNLLIDKKKGQIGFDDIRYLEKFISKNNLGKDRNEIINSYRNLLSSLKLEIRHHLNGHDFITIFFLYVNKIKNTPNYKENNFCRSLFLCVEVQMIENYPLFKSIVL